MLTRVDGQRVALKAMREVDVPDRVGEQLVSGYANVEVASDAASVVVANVDEAPPEDMPVEPEQPTTSTTGAMSTSDLKPGGRRGRRKKA